MADGSLFKNALGDTVTLRLGELRTKAREYEWRTRTAEIQFDDILGGEGIDVSLDTHLTSATLLTDEQMTMDAIRLGEDVTEPQTRAIRDELEARIIAAFRDANAKHSLDFTDGDDPFLVALEAKRLVDADKTAPATGRALFVGSNVAAQWVSSQRLTTFDGIGQNNNPAVRDATIGRLAGAQVVELPELDPDEAFYFHKTALVGVNIAPDVPVGVLGAKQSRDGYAMRQIFDYDARYVRNRSIVSSFFGVNDVTDARDPETGDLLPEADRKNVRLVKLNYAGTGSVFQSVGDTDGDGDIDANDGTP